MKFESGRRFWGSVLACAAVFGTGMGSAAPVIGTDDNDILFFEGTTGSITQVFVPPAGGRSVTVSGSFNVNSTTYDGLGGVDTLLATGAGDFLLSKPGAVALQNTETVSLGQGNDFVQIYGYSAPNLTVEGGIGNDVLMVSSSGAIRLNGGAGDDIFAWDSPDAGSFAFLSGGADNDLFLAGRGGYDNVVGATGEDTLVYHLRGWGHDAFNAGIGIDTLALDFAEGLADLTFGFGTAYFQGLLGMITHPQATQLSACANTLVCWAVLDSASDSLVYGLLSTAGDDSGLEFLTAGNRVFDLRSTADRNALVAGAFGNAAGAVPEPSSALLVLAAGLAVLLARRRRMT